jgi:hypothetical protein
MEIFIAGTPDHSLTGTFWIWGAVRMEDGKKGMISMVKERKITSRGGLRPAACLTILLMVCFVLPVAAATEEIQVIRYADNNYSVVRSSVTRDLTELQAMDNVYSNDPVYMQGPTFDPDDPWGDAGQNMIDFYEHNGTKSGNTYAEVTLTGEKTSDISNYVNSDNVTVLVKQKNGQRGSVHSYIDTDDVKLVVTHHHNN